MEVSNRWRWILPSTLFACFSAGWLIQSSLMFNSDASWLMLATKRLLMGGDYTHDFFEINPPMILYVYTPAVYLANIFSLPNYFALRIYVFLLIATSLFISYCLTRKIFADNFFIRNNFLIACAAVMLLLPMTEFGQREHLIVILSLPYFLLIALRLQNTAHIHSYFAFVIGLLVGFGVAIKPYFLAPALFIEIFYLTQRRRVKEMLRPEIMAIGLVAVFFISLILLFNRDYLTTVLPIITHFYYQKYSLPFASIICSEQAVFAYFAVAFYAIRYHYNPYQTFSTVLMLVVCGFLFVYIAQQTPWYYHVLPLLMTSSLLLVFLFSLLITQQQFCRREYYELLVFFFALFAYLCFHMSYISTSLNYFPVAFFSLFTVLAVVLLIAAGDSLAKIILLPAVVILASMAFYRYLLHSPLQIHIFLLTSVLIILFIALCIPKKITADKLRFMQFTLLGAVLFAVPFYQGGYVYNYSQAYKKLYGDLLTVLREYPQQSIFFFSNVTDFGFPALDYTQQTLASRFAGLGWSPVLGYRDNAESYAQAYMKSVTDNHFLLNAVAEDFNKYRPQVVLVDIRNTDADGVKRYFGNQQMDYIKFFSMDTAFKNTWQHYHYVKTVDGQPLFKFNIYLRYPSV